MAIARHANRSNHDQPWAGPRTSDLTRPREALDAPGLVEEIVAALPIGIVDRRSPASVPLYANAMAVAHGVAELGPEEPPVGEAAIAAEWVRDGRTIKASRRAVAAAGGRYDVTISADVTEQRRLEDDLFRRAYFDDLTGLPNRGLMEQSVRALIQNDDGATTFALAFIDIDNFKHINDYYGHVVGDGLLMKIARRIADGIRGTDMLARMGGDEFVLLHTPIGPPGASRPRSPASWPASRSHSSSTATRSSPRPRSA